MNKLKIAVPDNKYYERLYKNSNEFIEIIPVKEEKIITLMVTNRVDGALLNPLSYGIIRNNLDIRVVNSHCLSAVGFTNLSKVLFKSDIKRIKSIGARNPNLYLSIMSKIMLAERYGIELDITETDKEAEGILDEFDTAIILDENYSNPSSIDLTENWSDSYSQVFPIAMWCLRSDIDLNNFSQVFDDLYDNTCPINEKITEENSKNENVSYGRREGELIWKWDKLMEEACDNVLEILYYHQYISEIYDIKMYGESDNMEGNEEADTQKP